MTPNPAEQKPETALVRKVAELEREMVALKTRQLLGADNLNVIMTTALIHQVLPPNTRATYRMSFHTSLRQLFISETPGLSLYFNVDDDPDHVFPDGNALSGYHKNVRRECTYDPASSDETGSGVKSYLISIWNPDTTNSVDMYLHVALLLPKVAEISS